MEQLWFAKWSLPRPEWKFFGNRCIHTSLVDCEALSCPCGVLSHFALTDDRKNMSKLERVPELKKDPEIPGLQGILRQS